MDKNDDMRTESYLLRLWRYGRQSAWRASLRDVRSGETRHFARVEGLWAFLQGVMKGGEKQNVDREGVKRET
ncbi:MAG: hypothetical protein JXA21_17385 [Anaerolineae bacterium]|nr:hypothetical protein [Anaerolineae bacterium]